MVDVTLPAASAEQPRCSKQLLTLRLGLILGISLLNSACGTADSASLESDEPAGAQPSSSILFIPVSAGVNTVEATPGEGSPEQQVTGEPSTEPQGGALSEFTRNNEAGDASDTNDSATEVAPRASCSADDATMELRMLQLINDARDQARSCGDYEYSATRELSWNTVLASAASKHSADMVEHNFFSHTGSDGSDASERVTREGYDWSTVGENIAAGRDSAEETVNDWLESEGHCRNLMNPSFTEVAVSCAEDESTDYIRYWTNILAAPR